MAVLFLWLWTALAWGLPSPFEATLKRLEAPGVVEIRNGCEPYPELRNDVHSGLRKGFACLLGQSGRLGPFHERQAELLRWVLETFQPLHFSCTNGYGYWNASSTGPGQPMRLFSGKVEYPEVQLELAMLRSSRRANLDALLFHEMLHWAGLVHPGNHDPGPDLVQLYEVCCFGATDARGRKSPSMEQTREQACEILRDKEVFGDKLDKKLWQTRYPESTDKIFQVYKRY